MVEDYLKALEQIFAYGYGCCVFKHSIRGDRPRIPNGMSDSTDPLPLDFHPPIKVEAAKVHPVEAEKDPVEGAVAEELG